ncbi:MAG TPA: hypothetical protein VI703_07220 [Anaerolineales bacterium]|nr:hypothetical protein [Anaerolineales bacterium]
MSVRKTHRTVNPRCFLVYALAPEGMPAAEANRIFNEFVGDWALPLVVFHDHFIGNPGGLAIFFVEDIKQRDLLLDGEHLPGWQVEMHPLIFSYSPAAFDEQIAFTLNAYRDQDWERLQKEDRPAYGDLRKEAESAEENS